MRDGLKHHLTHLDIAPVLAVDAGLDCGAVSACGGLRAAGVQEAPDVEIYLESATNSFQDKFHMTLPEHVHGLSPHHAASLGLHHAAAGGIDSHAASNRCPSVWEPAAVVSRSRLSSMDGGKQLVCVWDLDETLIIFNSLLNGTYAAAVNAAASQGAQPLNAQACKRLGEATADIIFSFLDAHFMFPLVENLDPMHLGEHHHASHSVSALTFHHHQPLRPPSTSGAQPYAPAHHAPAPHHNAPPPRPHHMALQVACSSAPAIVQSPKPSTSARKRASSDPDCAPTSTGSVGSPAADDASGACLDSAAVDRDQQEQSKGEQGGPGQAEDQEQPSAGGPAMKRSKSCVKQELTPQQVLDQVARLYAGGFDSLPVTEKERQRVLAMRSEVDRLTSGWLSAARTLMQRVSEVGAASGYTVHHTIVTTGQLVASLGKLLLFGFADLVPAEDVYSASKQTKLAVFKKLRARWGITAAYLAVGDGAEEKRAAAACHWPFVAVSLASDGPAQADGSGAINGNAAAGAGGTSSVAGADASTGAAGGGSVASGTSEAKQDGEGEEEPEQEPSSALVYPASGHMTIQQLGAEALVQHALSRSLGHH